MRAYVRWSAVFFALIALVPLVIGLIGAFEAWLGFVFLLFGVPVFFLTLLIAAIVFLIHGIRVARELPRMRERVAVVLLSPALVAAAIVLALPLLRVGQHVGDLARLTINRDHYELIIAEARAVQKASWFEDHDGVTYSVDLGPPVRVAFNPAGMLDNWSGIIFDPSGVVMLADGFDPKTGKFIAPERVTKLFGGDLVGCRHLWGDYYRCSFT